MVVQERKQRIMTNDLGTVVGADSGFMIAPNPDRVRSPDVTVEVISPSNIPPSTESKPE